MSLITRGVTDLKNGGSVDAYTDEDLWADLGGAAEQKAFERRIQALTDPTTYSNERKAAMNQARAAVSQSFKTAYSGFVAAGISQDQAKALAQRAAQNEYALQRTVVNAQFPAATDNVYALGANRRAGLAMPLPGMNTTARRVPARRRAPAKRKAAKKKRR